MEPGSPRASGDIAIDGGVIASVGGKAGAGRREIDAGGLLVTPGWVDIHSHYDGQVAWDPYVTPSSWHGVTTVIMGNCGVGFAPVKRGSEEYLLNLMDAVEDIPTATLAAGINFEWETFGEYLDALSRMKRVIDIGAQVPHCAVRVYAMGERGAHNEQATPDDIARIAAAVREGIEAGALGASTSRTKVHSTREGELVPGSFASVEELIAIGRALGAAGHGVFEVISDMAGVDQSMEWMIRLTTETGLPISLAALGDGPTGPGIRRRLEFMKQANAAGARLVNQLAVRSPGQLMGLETSSNPLIGLPSYDAIAHLPLSERVARMRDPEVRARIVAEMPAEDSEPFQYPDGRICDLVPAWETRPTTSRSVRCAWRRSRRREGKSPQAAYYDTMLERDGRELVYRPFNYVRSYSLDPLRDLLIDPVNIVSLSATAARTAPRSATRARPPFCSRTGCATVAAMERFPWSWRSNARPVRPRYFMVWKTAARCFPV